MEGYFSAYTLEHNSKPKLKETEGKCPMSNLPLDLLQEVSWVLDLGANKYEEESWRRLTEEYRADIISALLRHLTQYINEDILDKESGRSHMAHIICNALFIMNMDKEEEEEDEDN